jgi:hypothetical protein
VIEGVSSASTNQKIVDRSGRRFSFPRFRMRLVVFG